VTGWTTSADIRIRAQRRWDDGTILRAIASHDSFPTVEVPLRGPRPAQIGDDLDAVRSWVSELEHAGRNGVRYTLTYSSVGGRLIGRNELPARAIVETLDQVVALLGLGAQVQAFATVLAMVEDEPVARAWVTAHPHRALELAAALPTLLAAYRWLRDARGSGRYLRQVSAPGVDTKFVERHRAVLAQLLGVSASGPGFTRDLGLSAKPDMLRIRPHRDLGLGLSDITAPAVDLALLPLGVRTAVVIENEITFLSTPVPAAGVVLWGKGFEVDRAASMPWLRDADVVYWGDLDTHGFAILNQLRAWLPHSRSFLMDRDTLLAHRERWGHEASPTTAGLNNLTADERAVYEDLVTDRFGDRIRLEQERIDWPWALDRLTYV
jgi:hypothetical protein